MAIFQTSWSNTASYTQGAVVSFSGVAYEALQNIAAPSPGNTNAIPFDNTAWRVLHIIDASDVYGIVEAVRLELNVIKNDKVNNSLIHLMTQAHKSFERDIRAPEMLDTRFAVVDANSRIRVPSGLLEPLRLNVNINNIENSAISIKRADPTEFRRQELGVDNATFFEQQGTLDTNPFIEYVYIPEGDYYRLAPEINQGAVIQVYGYYAENRLGTSVPVTNNRGEAINSLGETVEQWVANGNTQATFVQDVQDITSNWFSRVAPDLVIYSTLARCGSFVKDPKDIEVYQAYAEKAKQEVMTLIDMHDAGTEEFITLEHSYPS